MRRLPLFALALLPLISHGQTPSAGSLLQDIESGADIFRLPEVGPQEPLTDARELPDIPGLKVTVNEFVVRGASQYSADFLHLAVQDMTGEQLSITDLRGVANRIADIYRHDGWLVRVFLPRQDITSGRVTIQVQESEMGQIIFSGQADSVPSSRVAGTLRRALPKGLPVDLDKMSRALLLADDLPGISIEGVLQSGALAGQTDLAVDQAAEPFRRGNISVANSGSNATGRNRISIAISDNSPFGKAGQFNASMLYSDGTRYLSGAYSLPAGQDGLTLTGSFSSMNYKVIKGEAAALNARGSSQVIGMSGRYPWVRSRAKNLYLNAKYEHSNFANESSGSVTSDYRKDAFQLGLDGNLFDGWAGGGVTTASLSVQRSLLGGNRGTNAAVLPNAYNFWSASLSRNQSVGDQDTVLLSASRQHATDNLDSSDNLSVGGVSGVRAYPAGEGSAAEADQLSLEWRRRLDQGAVIKVFYDWALVRDRDQAVGDYKLRGYGAGADLPLPIGLDLTLTWAKPIGHHPNPANNDPSLNQDGTKFGSRVWASLVYDF